MVTSSDSQPLHVEHTSHGHAEALHCQEDGEEAALSCPHDVCDSVPLQELQEQRMAAIGNPAHKRETLGDKVRAGVSFVPRQLWGAVSTFHSVNEIIGQPSKL